MTDGETKQIIAQLATLQEGMRGLQRDGDNRDRVFEAERKESHESRRELHEKVNEAVADIAATRSDLRATTTTLETLKVTVETNAIAAAPTIEQFDQVRRLGRIFFWMIGGGGIAAAGTLIIWGEAIRNFVAGWLGR